MIEAPSRATQALAPFAFGLVLEAWGVHVALGLSAGASLVAFCALMVLRDDKKA